MPRLVTAFLVTCILSVTLVPHATAQTQHYKIDAGPISLDGPAGKDAVYPASAMPADLTLANYRFEVSIIGYDCGDQGWTSHDLTGPDGLYFHVDDFVDLLGVTHGRLVPIDDQQSLWCGLRWNNTGPLCHYACLPGYGNNWNQAWCTKDCLTVAASDVSVSFDATWDTETGYDYMVVEFDQCDDNWVEFGGGIGVYDGIGSASATHYIPDAAHGDAARIRLRFISDGAVSDEDCLWDSDGAVIIDNLRVDDVHGPVLPVEDFEDESRGDLASDDWEACTPTGYGDFACLFPGYTALQRVSPLEQNPTCMWGFFCASAFDYNCNGYPAQKVVPYENSDGEYIHNEIWSPWIPFSGDPGMTTHMDFDVYRDLTLDALVFYYWRVRSVENSGDCPDAWRTNNLLYYGGPSWYTHHVNLTDYLPFGDNTTELQVALGVIDMCKYWCGSSAFTGDCHSNSPMFDKIFVYRSNTQSWVVEDIDLFQDAFPEDGTTTGTVRCDTPTGDAASVLVTEPSVGIDYLTPGDSLSGPAVFCHVHNLPGGKSGSAVSGGASWPEVPAMSTPDWTVLQMAPGATLNQYTVDLADSLYTPGDTVEFYFSARDKTPHTSYYSNLIGRTENEADAQANPMEMTCLPAGGAAAHGILYVDYYDGYGAEPYFMQAFDALGITADVDRFDRRAPTSMFANSLSDQVAALAQIQGYGAVVWNSGSFETGSFAPGDYKLLFDYLNLTPGSNGLYLDGDNIATELAASADTYAGLLRSVFLNYTLVGSNHRDFGEMVSPLVIGNPVGYFVHGLPDTLVAFGGNAMLGSFDVITPSGSATLEMSYSGNAAHGAVVSQHLIGVGGYQAHTLLSGFSFHHIRDERPRGAYTAMDRLEHMEKALLAVNILTDAPVSAPGTPALDYGLAQNYPNPFNPITTIEYSMRERGRVRVAVYDVAGRLVRVLVDQVQPASGTMYRAEWDGTNAAGQHVASGVYFYRMEAGEFRQTRKMVLLK